MFVFHGPSRVHSLWLPCPFLTLAHFLMLTDFLPWELTERTDCLKASFRSSCMACSSPVVKIKTKVDGGLSHLRCGKYNFIFVFSNNNNNDEKNVCERFPSSTVVQKSCLSGKKNYKIKWTVLFLAFIVNLICLTIVIRIWCGKIVLFLSH